MHNLNRLIFGFLFVLAACWPLDSMAEAEAVENLEAVKASWQKIDTAYKTFQLSVEVAGVAFQGQAESKVGELSGSVEVIRSGDSLRIFQPAKQ
jgi:hypothetical protein